MEGERRVGKVLKQLPEGWRVWHALDVGGENINHVLTPNDICRVLDDKNRVARKCIFAVSARRN